MMRWLARQLNWLWMLERWARWDEWDESLGWLGVILNGSERLEAVGELAMMHGIFEAVLRLGSLTLATAWMMWRLEDSVHVNARMVWWLGVSSCLTSLSSALVFGLAAGLVAR